MKLRKLASLTLALVLALSLAAPALAANSESGSSSGTGEVEGVLDTDVFSVVVPTESTSAFNFILDPQGLIAATVTDTNSKYNGKSFEASKTLFFPNADDPTTGYTKTTDYSSKSNPLEVMNKSTMAVNVSVEAKVDADSLKVGEKTATLVETIGADDTTASIYLALSDGTTTKAITSTAATLTAVLDPAANGVYKTQIVDGAYAYAIDTSVVPDDADHTALAAKFDTAQFYLTGDCNANGDWTGLNTLAPKVTVTWNVGIDSAPSVAQSSYELTAGQDLAVSLSLGAGDSAVSSITKVTRTLANGKTYDCAGYWTYENGTLTFSSGMVDILVNSAATYLPATVTVTFDAGDPVTFTLTAPAA